MAENFLVGEVQDKALLTVQMAGEMAVRQMGHPPEPPKPLLRPPSRHIPLPMPSQPLWEQVLPLTDGVFGRPVR